jgi:hypothetical protein
LLIVACVGLFFIPAFVIRPFSYQSPKALMLAMEIRQYAPVLTVAFLLASVWLGVTVWRPAGKVTRVLLVVGLVLASFSTAMSRIDYFEWMFHPLPSPGFDPAASVKLDPKQMVMAVRFGNDARAYPIRAMAYHHLVNDVVSGMPVVVTY